MCILLHSEALSVLNEVLQPLICPQLTVLELPLKTTVHL